MSYFGYGEDCSAAHSAQQAADEARREVGYLRTDLDDRIRTVRADAENEAAGLRARVGDLEDQVRELHDAVSALVLGSTQT
jgi:hypothetical protein